MRKALPKMLAITRTLMVHETHGIELADGSAAVHICEKLRPKLGMLMGTTGFRTLLSRAVVLASAEFPSLQQLDIDPAGSLASHKAAANSFDTVLEKEEGEVLVAHLLSLLVAFIGESLTLQILGEIWPQLLANDSSSTTGDSE